MDLELDYGKLSDMIFFGDIKDKDGVFGQDSIYDANHRSRGTEYVVFKSNQIKSATDNDGEFSNETGNIYASSVQETIAPSVNQFVESLPLEERVNFSHLLLDGTVSMKCN